MPAPLDVGYRPAVLDEIEADVLRGFVRGPAAPPTLTRAQRAELKRTIGTALRAFARDLGFEVVVPGTHAGGISNQALFDLLAARGWDYGASTKRLRDYVRVTLLSEFEDEPVVPLLFEVRSIASGAILEWIARRLDRDVTDIERPALSPAYARAKRKRFGSGRAGSASGALADAIRSHGRIVLT